MKKLFFALTTMLTLSISANAMSYEQARNEALFLTDKMAYELNLTDEQYEAAYEINLDYLMGVTGRDDVFGTYWERRNLDLSYILLDWQWNAFLAATYFYRPLYWEAGYWHFGIYRHYPRRDYFYFGRPHFYATYRGGHAWHVTRITGHRGMDNRRIGNNRSYSGSGNFSGYRGNRRDNSYGGGGSFSGNRDNSNRRDNGYSGGGSFSGNRGSSHRSENGYSGGGSFNRSQSGSGNFSGSRSGNSSFGGSHRGGSFSGGSTRSGGSFGGGSFHGGGSRGGSFGGGSHGGGSFGGGSHGGGHGHGGGLGGHR